MRILGLVLLIALSAGIACPQVTDISYLDGKSPIPDDTVRPLPADGSDAATNPPGFAWVPEPGAASYTLQYSPTTDFSKPLVAENLKLNIHQPTDVLANGTWYWRYRAVFADGKTSGWSVVRSFRITRDSLSLRFPPFSEIRSNVMRGRPRLFVRPENLEELRASRLATRKQLWTNLEKALESKFDVPFMDEPVPYPNDRRTPEMWRKYYADIRVMTNAMEQLAFGYMASGDRRYADEAKRIMLYLCSWDPQGISRYTYEDEIAMPIAHSTCRAYDWMYDAFTPEERARVLDMMRVRVAELYSVVSKGPYAAKPYGSHLQRALMFLGEASISFMGEIEGCEEWLEYVLITYSCLYPPWGGADGSYVEGPWYWGSYIGWALQFVDALQGATGMDLYGKPFFRNTGYWLLYCTPPYCQMQPFGDGAWFKPVSGLKTNMYRLSSVYKNPYLRWWADTHESSLSGSHIMYLWHDGSVKAKAPTDLRQSRAFYDAGQVAMHSNLADGKEDVMFLMRSSPGGAWSHSFADQNGFYIQAFGEALAIPSGYRPFYGDEHHKTWTWETRAHNSILVNGTGQATRTRSSQGRIASALFTSGIDYACGDATKAYSGRLDKFLRHVIYLRPDCFVLIDELAAKEPSTYQWLLHAWEKMDVDERANRAVISKGDARLSAEWIWPGRLDFSQTDQFSAPTINNPSLENQWHLTAETPERARKQEFITVMRPYRANDTAEPLIERVQAPGVIGVRLSSGGSAGTVILNRLGGVITGLSAKSDAHIVALRETGGGVTGWLMQDGSYLAYGKESVRANTPMTLGMDVGKGLRTVVTQSAGPVEIRLAVPEARAKSLSEQPFRMGKSAITDDMGDPRFFRGTVKVDGRTLSRPEFRFDAETLVLTLKLPAGEHRVEIRATGQPM